MKLSEARENFIFKTTIDLGDGEYIKMRELTYAEYAKLQGKNDNEMADAIKDIFPNALVESSFTTDSGDMAPNKEVARLILESGTLFTKVAEQWINSIPFQKKSTDAQSEI